MKLFGKYSNRVACFTILLLTALATGCGGGSNHIHTPSSNPHSSLASVSSSHSSVSSPHSTASSASNISSLGVSSSASSISSLSSASSMSSSSISFSVISTSPKNAAVGVKFNRNITATFSQTADSATIDTTTFIVAGPDDVPLLGVVSYAGTTATFNPAVDLDPSTVYTATLKAAVADLAAPANHLAADFVWTFTTGVALAQGPEPVNLGTAGNYVILAKAAVSTTVGTAVTGNIGISPAAETFITGFGQARDATNEFSISSMVTGNLYAANMAVPTPAVLTTAVSDMETAYTDAAGRTLPDFTELGAGDISGLTLVPGLYKWGTGVLVSTNITLAGGANDVWIFQVAQDLTVSNAVIINLTGGAVAKNVFWQVAGQATLGTTSDFKGIILSQTQIVLQTGAVIQGRALAQTAVTLDANTVTAPAP